MMRAWPQTTADRPSDHLITSETDPAIHRPNTMPDKNDSHGSRRPTTPGPGSSTPPPTSGATDSDTTLKEWCERQTDQSACWIVVRLIACKFAWLRPDGSWAKKQSEAATWNDREACYRQAQRSTGLLYLYDRQ